MLSLIKQFSLPQISVGTISAAGITPIVDAGHDKISELAQQAATGLENPKNYLIGLVISIIGQAILKHGGKLIDKIFAKKPKKEIETK